MIDINPEVFAVNIVPLMLLYHIVTLAISTPKDDLNYASRLQEIKNPDTGIPYFKTVSFVNNSFTEITPMNNPCTSPFTTFRTLNKSGC